MGADIADGTGGGKGEDGRDLARRIEGARRRSRARPLADLVGPAFADGARARGFASIEIVTRWTDIAGADIARHAEPIEIRWPPRRDRGDQEPATLVLRVEGHWALEVQQSAPVILERVNRFFGWRCVGRIALRQGPLPPKPIPPSIPPRDMAAEQAIAAGLSVRDDSLRAALGRLGAALRRG